MPDGMPIVATEPTATTETAAPATQPAPAPAAPVYTQEQVDAMVRQAKDSAAAAARRAAEAELTRKANPPAAQKPETTTAVPVASPEQIATLVATEIAKVNAFNDAVREYGLNADQTNVLRQLQSMVTLPDAASVSEWVRSKATVFGKASTPAAPAATAPAATVPAPLAPSAPSAAVPLERDVSVMDMSPEQIHELMRKNGANPLRPYQLSNGRAARREMRMAFEAAVQSRRFRVG